MNTDNKALTVDQAANEHALRNEGAEFEAKAIKHFKAGAAWREQQDKEALKLANQLATAVHLKGNDIPQLLVGYTNEAVFHKLQQVFYNDSTL